VLYVHVHSGSDLVSADPDNLSDPYCVVLANKKKVRNTLVSEDQLLSAPNSVAKYMYM